MNIGMDHLYHIFVSKDVTVDATGLSDLADGELAIVKADGKTLMTAGETLADSEYFYIAQGTATAGEPILSPRIEGARIRKWTGKEYTPVTQQVSYIGYNENITTYALNNANDFTAGDVLIIHVNLSYDKEMRSNRTWNRTFFHTVTAAGVADTAVITADFVSQINSDPVLKNLITASAVTDGTGAYDGIKLVGKAIAHSSYGKLQQVVFEVTLDGDAWNTDHGVDEFGYIYYNGTKTATGTNSNVATKGIGTYDLVLDLERFAAGYNGQTNRTLFPIDPFTAYALSTEAYDMYVIEVANVSESVSGDTLVLKPQNIFIAVPYDAAANNGAALEAILNPYMASCPGAFANVNL